MSLFNPAPAPEASQVKISETCVWVCVRARACACMCCLYLRCKMVEKNVFLSLCSEAYVLFELYGSFMVLDAVNPYFGERF